MSEAPATHGAEITNMPPSPKRRKQLDARNEQIQALLADGLTHSQIGARLTPPITASGVSMAIRRARIPQPFRGGRVCALAECDVVFKPTRRGQKYCCYLHSKRGGERSRLGKEPAYLPCRLPECDEMVLCVDPSTQGSKRFCCRTHGSRHGARERSGYYDRLVSRTTCHVCGFWGPGLERHHIKPREQGGSDHPSNLVWLCWNHHRLVHAGLATINHRREFVDLRELVRERELEMRQTWGS